MATGRGPRAVAAGAALLGALIACGAAVGAWSVELASQAPGLETTEPVVPFAIVRGQTTLFATAQPLLAADTDTAVDVYARRGERTLLVSGSELVSGTTAIDPSRVLVSADGSRVVFQSVDPLLAADTDALADVYSWTEDGGLVLVSPPPIVGGGPDAEALPLQLSSDGSRVLFGSAARLDASDTDTAFDLYGVGPTGIARVSGLGSSGNGSLHAATYVGASDDGTAVAFSTTEQLVADTDAVADLYLFRDGPAPTLELVSAGTAAAVATALVSADGSGVAFATADALLPADTDTQLDAYLWAPGVPVPALALMTPGTAGPVVLPAGALSADGLHLVFETSEALVPADADADVDLYERFGGATRLVTQGPTAGGGTFPPTLVGFSRDGSAILFRSDERLVAADTDGRFDLYLRRGVGTTELLTPGGEAGASIGLAVAADDLSRVAFLTDEPLLASDADAAVDVYESSGGVTRLAVDGGPDGVAVLALSPDGASLAAVTSAPIDAADVDGALDVYRAQFMPDPPPLPPPAPPVPPAPAAPPAALPVDAPALVDLRAGAARLVGTTVRRSGGAIVVRLACVGRPRARCEGVVTLRARGAGLRQVKIGEARFAFSKPTKPSVVVPLSPAGRRLLGRGARELFAVVTTRMAGVKPQAFSATVTLAQRSD